MATSSSRFSHVSLGSMEGKIQLTDRQMQLLKQRKERQMAPPDKRASLRSRLLTQPPKVSQPQKVTLVTSHEPSKPSVSKMTSDTLAPDHSWGDEPTTTAPTTSWGSSSEASTDSSFTNPQHSFYGQRLKGPEKKLYDDTGASYHDSQSEASSDTSAQKNLASATALTEALTKSSSMDSDEGTKSVASSAASSLRQTLENSTSKRSSHDAKSEVARKGETKSQASGTRPKLDQKAELKKRLLASMAEKKKEQTGGKPPKQTSNSVKSSNRRTSFGLNRAKKTTPPGDDNQRAFLRKMMQSYTGGKAASKKQSDEAGSDVSSQAKRDKRRFSWSARKSTASSSNSGSSTSQDKAIMKKVLERARKKKSSNPRKKTFAKSSSSRMKKLLSPKSRSSDESANDQRSDDGVPRPGQSHSPKRNKQKSKSSRKKLFARSPRLKSAASRWSNNSHADDEAESDAHSLEKDDTLTASDSTAAETVTEHDSEKSLQDSVDQKGTELFQEHGDSVLVEDVLSEQSETETEAPASAQALKSASVEIHADDVKQHTLVSRPSVTQEDEIEIQVSVSSLSQRFQSSMPSTKQNIAPTASARVETETVSTASSSTAPEGYKDLMVAARKEFASYEARSQEVGKTALEMIYSEEPEGYAEFLATLRSEVAGSHSKLWESFRELFRGGNSSRTMPLTCSGGASFDDNTKDMVKNMSTYLKATYGVECNEGNQVANDKMAKETPGDKPTFGQHSLQPTRDGASLVDGPSGSMSEASSFDYSDKENGAGLVQVGSTDSINDGPASDEFEVTLGQFVRKSIGGPSESHKVQTAGHVKMRPASWGSAVSKPSPTDAIQKIKLKPTPAASSDTSRQWGGLKLRSVLDSNKSDSSESNIPASWAKVKLRSVASTDADSKTTSTSPKSVHPEDSSNIRRILVTKKAATKPKPVVHNDSVATEKPKEKDVIEIIDLADIPSTETNPIDLTAPIDLTHVGTMVDEEESKAESKSNGTMVSADGSVLVSLAPEPNSEPVKILIGKKGLAKITSRPGESKAQVVWRHQLDEVRSAMLDLSAFKVKLLLASEGDHKALTFATSEQCMRFANALHEMTATSDSEENEESMNGEESVYVEQLNEEEQRILEEFRQSKRSTIPDPIDVEEDIAEKPMSVINANASAPSSPLSEVSGAGSVLTGEEARMAETYQKMLKMRIPKDAVRHRMEKDGVDPKIVATVLGDADEVSPETGLTLKEEEAANGYRRMLKMGIPSDAVRHQMGKDGVGEKVVVAVLGVLGTAQSKQQEETAASQLSAEEEQVAQSYRKMLKMMIPKEAVEHKMRKDQVDPKIIFAVVGGSSPTPTTSKPGVPVLTDEEESMASSYRKMLTLRIPKDAIRDRMTMEGVSKKIIAAVLGEKVSESRNTVAPVRRGKQGGFHWSPLVSGDKLKKSVWGKSSLSDSSILDEDDDISCRIEEFQKKPESDEASKVSVKSTGDSKDMAKLIDLNRANNVAITLKAFNEFSQTELAQIIEFVDPMEKINGDRALFMRDLLPASAEIKVIRNYNGEEDRLVPAEKWFRKIVHIKRIEEKIHVLRTMESFKNEAVALGDTFDRLTQVCNQVMNSEKLPDLLEMVRQIGNRMNDGRGEAAAGFKLDFLPRLAQTKGSDRKTTALDLVVMVFHTRKNRQGLMLSNDFPDCHEASRLQIGELLADVRMLGGAMRKCKKELDLFKQEASKPKRAPAKLEGDSKSETELHKPSASKNQRSTDDEVKTEVSQMHRELFSKRANFIDSVLTGCEKGNTEESAQVQDFLKSAKNSDLVSEEEISPRASLLVAMEQDKTGSVKDDYDLQGAIGRIAKFMVETDIEFPQLEAKRDRAIDACRELSEFFCETGGEKTATTLLGILSEFATNLDTAVKKYDHQQKVEARKKASKDKKALPSSKSPTNSDTASVKSSSTTGEKKSLVLMVNEMLKVAGDKAKDDYVKGITYEQPDSRMKKIYAAEQELHQNSASPQQSASPRKNILHTIEERRQLHGTQGSQVLSELARAMEKKSRQTQASSPKEGPSDAPTIDSMDYSADTSVVTDVLSTEEAAPAPKNRNRRSIAERWSRKIDDDDVVEGAATQSSDDESFSIEQTDSEILAADSYDTEDRRYEEKKRQKYISRWASQNNLLGSASEDMQEEDGSKNDESIEYTSKTRQAYMSRWASKPGETEEEVDSVTDLLE